MKLVIDECVDSRCGHLFGIKTTITSTNNLFVIRLEIHNGFLSLNDWQAMEISIHIISM
jgi:hypothetical protein